MEDCDHDFRRVAHRHMNPERDNTVLAVLCCNCGQSPMKLLFDWDSADPLPNFKVNGDWPDDHKIVDWDVDELGRPSVEFEVVT